MKTIDIIERVIEAEIEALNSDSGKALTTELCKELLKQNPNMTPEQWEKEKRKISVLLFLKILHGNESILNDYQLNLKEELS